MKKYPNIIKEKELKCSEKVWVADITYLKTKEKNYYLHLITDAYSKKIVGYELSDNLQTASTIVDEAHAFGVFGYGLIEKYQLHDQVSAAVITYGKALGSHGAAILCNETVKSYLVNFASPFIYTTSAQDFQWMSIKTGYEFLDQNHELAERLQNNIKVFRSRKLKSPSAENSPVQAIVIPDNQKLKKLQDILSKEGFLTYAIYSPTVKEGSERLRICLHSFNTEEEIVKLTGIIKEFI